MTENDLGHHDGVDPPWRFHPNAEDQDVTNQASPCHLRTSSAHPLGVPSILETLLPFRERKAISISQGFEVLFGHSLFRLARFSLPLSRSFLSSPDRYQVPAKVMINLDAWSYYPGQQIQLNKPHQHLNGKNKTHKIQEVPSVNTWKSCFMTHLSIL